MDQGHASWSCPNHGQLPAELPKHLVVLELHYLRSWSAPDFQVQNSYFSPCTRANLPQRQGPLSKETMALASFLVSPAERSEGSILPRTHCRDLILQGWLWGRQSTLAPWTLCPKLNPSSLLAGTFCRHILAGSTITHPAGTRPFFLATPFLSHHVVPTSPCNCPHMCCLHFFLPLTQFSPSHCFCDYNADLLNGSFSPNAPVWVAWYASHWPWGPSKHLKCNWCSQVTEDFIVFNISLLIF